MNEVGSLLTGLLVIAILLALVSFVVHGKAFRLPSRPKGRGGSSGVGRSRAVGNRSVFEVFFALLALANLIASQSAAKLGAPALVLGMIVLVGTYALFSDVGMVIVVLGAIAAVADVALTEGTDVAVTVAIVAVFLAWIFGAVRLVGSGR